MLKKIIKIALVGLIFIPTLSFASAKSYVTQNFEESLTEEKIEHDLGKYKESNEKINIYLFRGNGCTVCRSFLTWLYNNVDEYGKYFNLVSYEIFYDADNSELLSKVSKFMGQEAEGVPYIVIGDNSFEGFREDTDGEKIKNAIKKLYESKDRYDVFEEMEKAEKESSKDSSPTIIMWNAIFTVVAVFVVLYVNNRKVKELSNKIDLLEKSLHNKK